MAIFGYGRVSTKEQTTENQRREIEAAGYAVDFWHADDGVSGKVSAAQRPQFAPDSGGRPARRHGMVESPPRNTARALARNGCVSHAGGGTPCLSAGGSLQRCHG